jgi:hypothetical protein
MGLFKSRIIAVLNFKYIILPYTSTSLEEKISVYELSELST